MTASLSYRGPDRRGLWSRGTVGFGHTLLRTYGEAAQEAQPLTLDGRAWIVADARIDGRGELIRQLRPHAAGLEDTATDAELILRAWHVWGEECVLHLYGDFAFAVWDEGSRALFCVRDHVGVKPFYYACRGGAFIF